MARPTKLTPEAQERICQAIRLGATYEHAAQRGGIGYSTLRDWVLRGEAELDRVADNPRASIRADELIYVEFSEALKEAESDGILANLAHIRKAAQGDEDNRPQWQAAAWLLERRHPNIYGRRVVDSRVELTGKDGGPVKITWPEDEAIDVDG